MRSSFPGGETELQPFDLVLFTSYYNEFILQKNNNIIILYVLKFMSSFLFNAKIAKISTYSLHNLTVSSTISNMM